MMSDSVVLLHNGYVVAEGEVHGVRDEIEEHPMQILIRCDRPQVLAARLFEHEHTIEARIHEDRQRAVRQNAPARRFPSLAQPNRDGA